MLFELTALRLSFRALEPVRFPPGAPGNILRGGFGHAFRKLACTPDCPGAKLCPARSQCIYARVFEPAGPEGGPSGLSDSPRPFVLRAAHLDGKTIVAGETFDFHVHLFDGDPVVCSHFVEGFAQLMRDGMGAGRGRAELQSAKTNAVRLDLAAGTRDVDAVRIVFLTPTELKIDGRIGAQPEFTHLFARVRDRLSTLRALYGAGPLEINFKQMGERASAVRLIASELRTLNISRHSSRTGQTHGLGGFTGWADYEGALTPFLPFLRAAKWTGVGRHCVWGNGEIELRLPDGGMLE